MRGFDYSSRRYYFVTMVAYERRNYFSDERIAEAVLNVLLSLKKEYEFNIYQYCLMPDHLHIVSGIGKSEMSLSRICGGFKSLSTKVFWQFGKGKLWQRQFYDHIIRGEEDFHECVKYTRLNPVRKGLVEDWKDWKYTASPDLDKVFEIF